MGGSLAEPWRVSVQPLSRTRGRAFMGAGFGIGLVCAVSAWAGAATARQGARAIHTVPGMPPVVDPNNLYSETQANKLLISLTQNITHSLGDCKRKDMERTS